MDQNKANQLAAEQEYFDKAWDAYEESLEMDSPKNWTAGTAAERQAMKKHVEAKERLNHNEAVAHGRIVEENGNTVYVGKVGISGPDRERMVVSWKAPIAQKFYQASAQSPQGVAAKRTYDCQGNEIQDFQELVYSEIAAKIETIGDELRMDDALLKSLGSRRTGKMKDIVQTIQASQDKLIRSPRERLLIIQGGPGTGKTAVALHRASWLLYEEQIENGNGVSADDLLIVGPNPAFIKYIQQVLPALGDDKVEHSSIQELLVRNLSIRANEPDEIAAIKGSADMEDLITNALDARIRVPSSPLRIARRNSASRITIPPEMIAEDIEKLRPEQYGTGRLLLKERLLAIAGSILHLRGGQSAADELQPNSVDAALDRMWPRISATQFVRELYSSRQRLETASINVLDADQVAKLHRPAAESMAQEPWTQADLAIIDFADSLIADRMRLWGHIIVDEAQDLSPMEFRALRRRSRTGSMTLVGDIAQSTGAFAREGWQEVIDLLKRKIRYEITELKYGYRVPKEVYDVAAQLLATAAPGTTPPEIIRSSGIKPVLYEINPSELTMEVARVAKEQLAKDQFIGVIALPEQWDLLQETFHSEEIPFADSQAGDLNNNINFVTPIGSKGLEFDSVFVIDPQAILDLDPSGRQLYVALTRTTSDLTVFCPTGSIPTVIEKNMPSPIVVDNIEPEDAKNILDETEKIIEEVGNEILDEAANETSVSGPASTQTKVTPQLVAQRSTGKLTYTPPVLPTKGNNESKHVIDPLTEALVDQNAAHLVSTLSKSFEPEFLTHVLKRALTMTEEKAS